jgi:hypothetical protein
MNAIPSPKWLSREDRIFLGGLAALKLLLHLPVLGRYGYHHDELYFIACGRHLAFGYVDHAPLVPWIARLADELFGASLYGLRIFSALAGALTVFLTALLVRRLGGGRFAQALACLPFLTAPMFLRTHNLLHLPAFEVLFWVAAVYLVVRVLDEDEPRLWLWVGLLAGIGLLAKHSMLLFGFGLAVGLALTPQRKHFRSPWLYAGGAVAVLVFLPNLLWQVAHGWPTLEFLRQLNAGTMSGISALQFVLGQVLYFNPLAAPVWIAGLVFYFSQAGRRFRALGWTYVALFVLLALIKSKIYYLAPAYPMLFAGGSIAIEQWGRRHAWLRPVTAGAVVLSGLVFLPVSLPVLSIDATERYVRAITFGAFENVYELTADLRGMFAWEQRVEIAAEVYHRLPPAERERTVVIGSWYGTAAALDFFGRELGLPPAVSTHMTYHLWGLPDHPIDTAVAVDVEREHLEEFFEEVTVAAQAELANVNPWERHFTVSICRRPKVDIRQAWPQMRRY